MVWNVGTGSAALLAAEMDRKLGGAPVEVSTHTPHTLSMIMIMIRCHGKQRLPLSLSYHLFVYLTLFLFSFSFSSSHFLLYLSLSFTPFLSLFLTLSLTHNHSLSVCVQVRVTQGKEPQHFLELFKGKTIIHKGGHASSFNNSDDADRYTILTATPPSLPAP